MSAVSKFGFGFQLVGVFASALLLASCSTVASPVSDATTTESAMAASSAETDAEMAAMRDECKAMHEEMKVKMAEGGMMSEDGMKSEDAHMAMSADMKERHKKCMETMPELKEEMQAHCKEMKKEAASDSMHKRCKMMAAEPAAGDGGEEEK